MLCPLLIRLSNQLMRGRHPTAAVLRVCAHICGIEQMLQKQPNLFIAPMCWRFYHCLIYSRC